MSENSSNNPTPPVAPRASLWRRLSYVLPLSLWVSVTFVASQFAVVWLFRVLGMAGISFGSWSQNLFAITVGIVIYATMFALLIGGPWLIWRRWPSLRTLGIHRLISWLDIGLSLSGTVVYFIAAALVTWLVSIYIPSVDLGQPQSTGIVAPRGIELALTFVLLVVVGPFVEELVFRGYLYGKLRAYGVPFLISALVVSVLFAAAHLQWNVAINVFVLSLVMCVAREVSGSIWPSILMHVIKNGIAFYLLFVLQVV